MSYNKLIESNYVTPHNVIIGLLIIVILLLIFKGDSFKNASHSHHNDPHKKKSNVKIFI